MPKSPPRNANAPSAVEAFKNKNQTSEQRDFKADSTQAQAPVTKYFKQPTNWETLSLGYKTKWLVQRTFIHPPALKLLAVNLADHVDSKTGHAWPSIALLAIECSVTTTHIKRLLSQAKLLSLIEVVSQGGGATSTRYRFPLQQLGLSYRAPSGKSISEGVVKNLRVGQDVPGTSMYPVHGCTPTGYMDVPPPGTPMCHEPPEPQNPSFGREGAVLPSDRASPVLGRPVQEIPAVLRHELFEALVANGTRTPTRISALIEKANELVQAGHDINAMAQQALEAGWKRWPLPPRPMAAPDAKRRTTGRTGASVIDPIRDTRAADRNYDLPGVNP